MQMELVETFLDLCDTRNFNRTAERLGVTQSAVSGRVAALEKAVGARLFNRSRSGTELTTEGLRFEPHARALRHGWMEALNATRLPGTGAAALRIGIQHDLVDDRFPALIGRFRETLNDTALFFEADYSVQMCSDLIAGAADLGILFSPRAHPDLYFETVGEVAYHMVSSTAERLSAVSADSYILAKYSPAFSATHAALHPGLSFVSLSIGQSAAMSSMLGSLGGSAYVLRQNAEALVATGRFRPVADAAAITQTVFCGLHMRNRHRGAFRHLVGLLREHFAMPVPMTRRRRAPA
ncbi:MAG: LysR family transcriptional regulator [Rhizobiaceae bacterium]|nr:LysR family transcriptional regulator [Rhizobiaceae bacterium]